MSSTEATVRSMMHIVVERGIDPNSTEAVALALLDARFTTREINDNIEAVQAGARVTGRCTNRIA